jgi:phage repressor protein C with HTH and peptisase S24 domain
MFIPLSIDSFSIKDRRSIANIRIVPIHQKIREARQRLGLTEQQFADAVGVSRGSVQQWEKEDGKGGGGTAPSRKNQPAVARVMGISVAELMGKELRLAVREPGNVEPAGQPRIAKPTPVVGTARMGEDGFYEALDYPVGQGDGIVDSHSPDPNAYALRVKGDSMHPAIRHGSFVVVEPNGRCMPGEYVVIALVDGRKMVKELVIERPDEIVVESVNGNHRKTWERSEIERMHPVSAIVAASKWRQE